MDQYVIFYHEAIAILARTLYGEARGQSRVGKIAVANVMLNRVRAGGWWGDDIVEVCLMPLQFSAWNDDDPNRKKMLDAEDYIRLDRPKTKWNSEFEECLEIAKKAVDGELEDNTYGSTHYINPDVADPYWARDKRPAIVIGDHAFYNNVE